MKILPHNKSRAAGRVGCTVSLDLRWEELTGLIAWIREYVAAHPEAKYTPHSPVTQAEYARGQVSGADKPGCIVGLALRAVCGATDEALAKLKSWNMRILLAEAFPPDGAGESMVGYLDDIQSLQDQGGPLHEAVAAAWAALPPARQDDITNMMTLHGELEATLALQATGGPIRIEGTDNGLLDLAQKIAHDILCYLSYEADPRTRVIENDLASAVYDVHEEKIEALILQRLKAPNAPQHPAGAGPGAGVVREPLAEREPLP